MKQDTMEIQTCKKGQVIFRQGDIEPCMYDIQSGKVGIYAEYGTDREQLLTTLGENSYFGEMGFIESSPRSATAVCLENGTKLLTVTRENFYNYFRVLEVMQGMSHRLRELTEDYMDACRTVAETVRTQQSGTPVSPELKAKQEGLAALSRKGE